jgi:hyperosmotically inducible periplasmic protein
MRGVEEIAMSYFGRLLASLSLAMLMLWVVKPVSAQVAAVKDGWLVMKVHSEMLDETVLSGSNIDVDVKNGVVTLQGTVPSEAARVRALECARRNDGVKSVVDQLRIAPAHGTNTAGKVAATQDSAARAADKTEDALEKAGDKSASAAKKTGRAIEDGWIKSKIYAQYLADWNTVLNDSDIDVDVANNVVTLNGVVKSTEARTRAVSIAKGTDGVKSVKDNLRVGAAHS